MTPALQNNLRAKLPIESRHYRSAYFPNNPNFPLILLQAALVQEFNSHEVLTLKYSGRLYPNQGTLVSGDPVEFSWGSARGEHVFVGYVHSVKATTIAGNMTEVYCVSPSYLLKNTDQKIYKNVTADVVVSKIAAKYGLKAITQRHPRVFPSIVQAGQSDWQLLRQLANITGFALKTEKTNIYFMSKSKIEASSKRGAPLFYKNTSNTNSALASQFGTIVTFNPIMSDEAPDMLGATVDRVVSGIHQTNGNPISTIHKPKLGSKATRGVVIPSESYLIGEV